MKRKGRARKSEDAQRAAILQDKVALLQGDLAKINPPKPVENGNGTGGDKPKRQQTAHRQQYRDATQTQQNC